MTNMSSSHLKAQTSISPSSVPPSDFLPDSGNLFPKWPHQIDKGTVEVWLFDGIAADASSAVTVSFYRDVLTAPAGFRVAINANWADGTKWGGHPVFAESVVTSEGPDIANGRVVGVWQSISADGGGGSSSSRASFEVAADLSTARVSFDVPGKVTGTIVLTTSSAFQHLPKTAEEAKMSPEAYWMRPIAMAGVTAHLTFTTENPEGTPSEKLLRLDADQGSFGGMDRAWSPLSWAKLISDSWFLRARAGPYLVQAMRLIDRPERGHALHATARLYHNGKLECAAQRAIRAGEGDAEGGGGTADAAGASGGAGGVPDVVVIVEKLFDESSDLSRSTGREQGGGGGVTGAFRDKNVGYRIEFRTGIAGQQQRRWAFESRHRRGWWNTPTGPPGPNATGLSGFVDTFVGGVIGSAERFEGVGIAGQGDMP
ncbi:hypothetical protein NKR23_g3430 [Pleurostoma richardsiae]|uniref:Diels-Alderase n=1 Tax=Pleurostoma richardsiae TaxID=41990 RepID=A0AA38RYR3_9PEZI|nr:hypothetical protein NKR23_g3430 [Pleurostoma richardsiae]